MVWLIIYNVKIWVFLESLHSQTNKLYLGKTRRVPTNNMLPLNEKKHYHFLRQKHLIMSLISDNEAVSSQLITLTLIFYTQNIRIQSLFSIHTLSYVLYQNNVHLFSKYRKSIIFFKFFICWHWYKTQRLTGYKWVQLQQCSDWCVW